jgi:hypothetical protein
MNTSNFPQAVGKLYEWLVSQGFSVVEEREDGSQNRLVVLERDKCRIRLLTDRSECSVAVSFSGRDWIHPDVWESYLDDFPLAGDLSALEDQVRFLMKRLMEITQRASPDVDAELLRIGDEYMRRRLGVGPE